MKRWKFEFVTVHHCYRLRTHDIHQNSTQLNGVSRLLWFIKCSAVSVSKDKILTFRLSGKASGDDCPCNKNKFCFEKLLSDVKIVTHQNLLFSIKANRFNHFKNRRRIDKIFWTTFWLVFYPSPTPALALWVRQSFKYHKTFHFVNDTHALKPTVFVSGNLFRLV